MNNNNDMFAYENKYKDLGYKFICGVDEVGRGCLFGPLVSASVIMPFDEESIIEGINDSKKLSEKKRNILYKEIIERSISYSVCFIEPSIIDEINIYNATKLAMTNAINNMSVKADFVLIDAMKLDIGIENLPIIKGDSKSYSIASASIIAKVVRDNYIIDIAKKYPFYNLEKNKGYGTKAHIDALEKYGETEEHRKTFAPLKYKYINTLF
jgi:ribonuclease HII